MRMMCAVGISLLICLHSIAICILDSIFSIGIVIVHRSHVNILRTSHYAMHTVSDANIVNEISNVG